MSVVHIIKNKEMEAFHEPIGSYLENILNEEKQSIKGTGYYLLCKKKETKNIYMYLLSFAETNRKETKNN